MKKKKGSKGSSKAATTTTTTDLTTTSNDDLIWVDPARVRFQHARIRPYFSGCGRSVQETLHAMREGKVLPRDIPPIQVIIGPETTGQGPWYFSLNNRRLWVFKRLREEGLLPNNQIAVRVRTPKSEAERNRYTVENCALEAKLMREGPPSGNSRGGGRKINNKNSKEATKGKNLPQTDDDAVASESEESEDKLATKVEKALEVLSFVDKNDKEKSDEEPSSDESSVEIPGQSNPFSVLG